MKTIKVLLSICLLSLYAQTAFAEKANINQIKQNISSDVDKRIQILNTYKICVQAAKVRPNIKTCRANKKAAMQALKAERKLKRAPHKGQ
ncbi:hypothetical protein [Candidatus Venteria ishoeyi]|uniref:Uncharacterized protein n=1 Tax=Candidatus Venteria ishoeyi TaxID=1899563 RepID=A0A1H6FBY4_9GAMM|nr:hypothetical protein [Candidatus Venteria ishoeyi]MDM8545501.1 hypothetical protein [Candidatus Venteria ishoeyi]SEH07588.1 Uncharacterised protein [Candidatus Venteria ishoeyi]